MIPAASAWLTARITDAGLAAVRIVPSPQGRQPSPPCDLSRGLYARPVIGPPTETSRSVWLDLCRWFGWADRDGALREFARLTDGAWAVAELTDRRRAA